MLFEEVMRVLAAVREIWVVFWREMSKGGETEYMREGEVGRGKTRFW